MAITQRVGARDTNWGLYFLLLAGAVAGAVTAGSVWEGILTVAAIATIGVGWRWGVLSRCGFWLKEVEPDPPMRRFKVRSLWRGEVERLRYYLSPTYTGSHRGERVDSNRVQLGRVTVQGDWSGGDFPGHGAKGDNQGGKKHNPMRGPVRLGFFETFTVACHIHAEEEFNGYLVLEGEFVKGANRRGRVAVVEVPETEEPVY